MAFPEPPSPAYQPACFSPILSAVPEWQVQRLSLGEYSSTQGRPFQVVLQGPETITISIDKARPATALHPNVKNRLGVKHHGIPFSDYLP